MSALSELSEEEGVELLDTLISGLQEAKRGLVMVDNPYPRLDMDMVTSVPLNEVVENVKASRTIQAKIISDTLKRIQSVIDSLENPRPTKTFEFNGTVMVEYEFSGSVSGRITKDDVEGAIYNFCGSDLIDENFEVDNAEVTDLRVDCLDDKITDYSVSEAMTGKRSL